MKKLLKYSGIILLFFFMAEAHALVINEVLYDPAGSDNNKEFIEVVSDEPVTFTGWIIADSEANDTLVALHVFEQTEINETSYALIVEEGFNFTDINASIYSAGATIGNNLNNDGDEIKLFDSNGTLVATMRYNQTLNGTSIEYVHGMYEESLTAGGTPGRKNSRTEQDTNETTNETGVETIEFILPVLNETENDMENETTTEQTPEESTEETEPAEEELCTASFTINTSHDLILNKEQLFYTLNIAENATFEYWIEDLSGAVVRKKRATTSAAPKSFTPSITEQEKAFLIQANAYADGCSFHAEKLMVVENQGAEQKETKPKPQPKRKEKEQRPRQLQRIQYTTTNIPEKILLENNTATLAFFLDIANDDVDHRFEAWSYVFRGPKSYSGGREENKHDIVLGAGQEARIPLVNTVNLTPGIYTLKIKIRKDDQVSTTDLMQDIVFEAPGPPEKKVSADVKQLLSTLSSPSPQSVTPIVRVVQRRSPLSAILGTLAVGVIIVFIWVKG